VIPAGARAAGPDGLQLLLGTTEFELFVQVPPGWRALSPEELPAIDVSRLPGAEVAAIGGWDGPAAILRAGCARGPSTRFAPGIEEVLFEKATWLALTRAGVRPAELGVTHAQDGERSFVRVLEGREGEATVRLEHLILFAGEDSDVILCSTLCRGGACAGAGQLEIQGTTAPLPTPSLLVRGAVWAAGDPWVALGAVGFAAALVVALILWRRPYPRP
jgi:hypothetical protein